MRLTIILLVFSFMLTPKAIIAKTYKWTDNNGSIHFSDKPAPVQNRKKVSTVATTATPVPTELVNNASVSGSSAIPNFDMVYVEGGCYMMGDTFSNSPYSGEQIKQHLFCKFGCPLWGYY